MRQLPRLRKVCAAMNIEMLANVTMRATVNSVDDLRALVRHLDKYGVADDAGVEFSYSVTEGQFVWISPLGDDAVNADWIECGDHIPPDYKWDIIVDTHSHNEATDPAPFDWPTKDRLKR